MKVFRLDVTPEHARALADELQRVADAGLDHPSIVRMLGAGVEGSLAYSAHEYVAAESLDIALRHYAPAGLDMVLPFITQLAGAVDFARAAGIGHGALHPRDIFVTPDEARATGFGVVQALEATGLRAPVRRPYTAPERVDGGAWGVTADVYSLGAIAFELLTARRPVGSEIGSLGSPAGPHAEDIAQAISRALSADPAHRYPSALAFAAALEASSRGERTAGAVEDVHAVASGVLPIAVSSEQRSEDVHELTVEPERDDVSAEREADLADIQLREQEPSHTDWPHETTPPAPGSAVRPPIQESRAEPWSEFAGRDADHVATPFERPPDREAPVEKEGPERSLFDADRDGEDGIPEVQHSGFQPGVLEPGYQSEPPPPEGWDPIPPISSPDQPTGAQDERDWVMGHAPGLRGEPARAEERRAAPVIAPPARAPRRRSVVLPVTITLLLGLFVGFLAGYLVFVRDGNGTSAPGTGAGGVAESPQAGRPASETPPRGRTQPRAPEGPVETAAAKPAPTAPAPRPTEPSRAATPRTRAPSVTPARGRLVVRSNPSGAQVYLNGRRRGTTPLALRDLAPGAYTVRLSREGFADTSQRVTVGGSAVREVTMRLARRAPPAPTTFTGSLYLDSRPRGARVILDGKEVGTTPMQIADVRAGAHVVRLELAGHHTWTTSARVVAGQVARVTGSLERMP